MMQILNPKRIQIIYQCCNKKSYKIWKKVYVKFYIYLIQLYKDILTAHIQYNSLNIKIIQSILIKFHRCIFI